MANDDVPFDQSTYWSYVPGLSMPTMATDAVSLDLSRSSLDELKLRFRAVGNPVSPSKAWLVCEHGNRDGRPPIGGLIDGYNSPSVESSPSTWWSGCAIAALGVQFQLRGFRSLTPICEDAARTLKGLPAAVQKRLWRELPRGAAPKTGNELALWVLAVFEMANANVVGSPLRAVRQILRTGEQVKTIFAPESKLPADSDWFATLPDFAAASTQAIDILLSWLDAVPVEPAATSICEDAKPKGTADDEPTEAEFVFRPDGDGYYLTGFGEAGHVTAKGAKGLHDLYRLVQTPGVPVPMIELDAGPGVERLPGDAQSRQPIGDGRTFADIAAKRRQLMADIEAADSDLERDELQTELGKLETEAKKMKGINGKARDLNNANNRLRSNIHGRIATACERMKECQLPRLADHFANTCSADGAFYIYAPGTHDMGWDTAKKQ